MIEGAWRLVGAKKAPPMTRFAIAMMSSTVAVSIDKARQQLGYQPIITVEEGLRTLPKEWGAATCENWHMAERAAKRKSSAPLPSRLPFWACCDISLHRLGLP